MDFTYRPTEYELSLSVLYVINNLKTSATARILDLVISPAVKTSYFEIGHITFELMKSGYIKNIELNGETVFSITDSGEAAIKYFYHSIPYSVREKFLKSIEVINRQAKSESEIIVKCIPVNESEYMVECEINEAGESLLKLSLNAGNREMAESAAQKFKDNHGEIYNMIIRAMS